MLFVVVLCWLFFPHFSVLSRSKNLFYKKKPITIIIAWEKLEKIRYFKKLIKLCVSTHTHSRINEFKFKILPAPGIADVDDDDVDDNDADYFL